MINSTFRPSLSLCRVADRCFGAGAWRVLMLGLLMVSISTGCLQYSPRLIEAGRPPALGEERSILLINQRPEMPRLEQLAAAQLSAYGFDVYLLPRSAIFEDRSVLTGIGDSLIRRTMPITSAIEYADIPPTVYVAQVEGQAKGTDIVHVALTLTERESGRFLYSVTLGAPLRSRIPRGTIDDKLRATQLAPDEE